MSHSEHPKDQDLFESAFRFAAIGMAIISLEGKWLKVNSSVCRMLGYSLEELQSLDFQRLTHPDDLEADLKQVAALIEGEIVTYQMEKRYFRKDGSLLWGLLSVSLIRGEDSSPEFFISQIQDITSLKDAEKKLLEGERFKSLLRFSIQIAHEVNNPLTIMILYSQMIRLELEAESPDLIAIGKYSKVMEDVTGRISDITKTLSSLSIEKMDEALREDTSLSQFVKDLI